MKDREKECSTCSSPIPITANKCIHCGSFQNWRKYLDFGNTSIALVLALITVIGVLSEKFINLYQEIFSKDISVIQTISRIDLEEVSVLFTNTGESRVQISDGILCRVPVIKDGVDLINKDFLGVRNPKYDEVEAFHIMVYTNNERAILEKGKSIEVKFTLHERRPVEGQAFDKNVKQVPGYCHIGVKDLKGSLHSDFVKVSAMDLNFMQKGIKKVAFYNAANK